MKFPETSCSNCLLMNKPDCEAEQERSQVINPFQPIAREWQYCEGRTCCVLRIISPIGKQLQTSGKTIIEPYSSLSISGVLKLTTKSTGCKTNVSFQTGNRYLRYILKLIAWLFRVCSS